MWADSWIEELTPTEKLIWIYLLTGPYTNMLGIYEVSIKRISSDTGVNSDTVKKALEGFEMVSKCYYFHGHIFITNWIKNQSMNPNMIKSAKNDFIKLPNHIKESLLEKGIESFESLSNGYVIISKIEKENEKEIEDEIEIEDEEDYANSSQKSEHTPEEIAIFQKWISWIKENAPDINKLPEPLTIDQLMKLREAESVEMIQNVMMQMHNYKALKKYKSTYLTLKNWIKREKENKKPQKLTQDEIIRQGVERLRKGELYSYDDSGTGGV